MTTEGASVQGSLFAIEDDALQSVDPGIAVEPGRRQDLYTRGMQTLQIIRVINHLEDTKLYRGETWGPYDLQLMQLHAIRTVVDHMDLLQGGIGRLTLTRTLVELAQKMAPHANLAMPNVVSEVVINWLLNTGDDEDVYRPSYSTLDSDGKLHTQRMPITILRERQDPDGGLVIRASVEAINLLLGALTDDVADGQRAEERLLAENIESGRFESAVDAARRARLRSIQYAEHLARYLISAQQDIGAIDWAGTIREELNHALIHIQDRLRDEGMMWDRAEEKRQELEGSERVNAILRVQSAIKDCLGRHTRLHGLLLEAGPTFRLEQQQQRFARAPTPFQLSLRHELTQILQLAVPATSGPLEAFFRSLVGPVPRTVVDLSGLAVELTAPAREILRSTPALPEPALLPDRPPERFSSETVAAARQLFMTCVGQPRRLSALFVAARDQEAERGAWVVEYLRLLALDAFETDEPEAPEGEAIPRAYCDGLSLEDPSYGGDDLLIACKLSLAGHEKEPPRT